MAERTSGVVEKIFLNDKGFYNCKIGSNWYGFGKYAPKFKEGDTVQFEYSMNGKFANVDYKSVQVVSEGAPSVATAASNKASFSKDDYWLDRAEKDIVNQKKIQYQSARKDALVVAGILLEQNAVTLPAAKNAKYDAILSLVDELTNTYYKHVDELEEGGNS